MTHARPTAAARPSGRRPPQCSAGPGPHRYTPLHGRRGQPRQNALIVHPGVGDVWLGLVGQHPPPDEQPVDAPRERRNEDIQVAGVRRQRLMELETAPIVLREHAVEHEGMGGDPAVPVTARRRFG